jgi:hypothetical protein
MIVNIMEFRAVVNTQIGGGFSGIERWPVIERNLLMGKEL